MIRILSAVLAVCLVVAVAGCKRNQPPSIIAVKAFPDQLSVGDSTDLIVSVSDPENEPLKYKWSAKDGKLADGKDSVARWLAPDRPGKYKIQVTVTDKRGATDTRTLELSVGKAPQVYSGSLGAPEVPSKRGRDKVREPRRNEDQPKKRGKGSRTK
jgi:hypothetical protein